VNVEDITEPPFPAAAARLLANALYHILKENQGIICQGENEDGKMKRAGIWKSEGMIKIIETYNKEIPLGSLFIMHKTEGDALSECVFDDGSVMEL